MRISDWSSDVFSSDLTALRADPSSVTRIVWSVSTHSPDTSASDNRIASATIREKMDRRTAMSAPVEQAVARPPDGFERRGRKTLLQLAAQPSDIDVDDIGLGADSNLHHDGPHTHPPHHPPPQQSAK